MDAFLFCHVIVVFISAVFGKDPCQRQPFYSTCVPWPNSSEGVYRSQVVIRYYRHANECISYPYGLCKNDAAAAKLYRYQHQCEKVCLKRTDFQDLEAVAVPPPVSFIAEMTGIQVEQRDDMQQSLSPIPGQPVDNVIKAGVCPFPQLGEYAVCVRECHLDYECPRDTKCCYNGCGRLCLQPQAAEGDPCGQSRDHGGCYGYFRRWSYDAGINGCKQFIYGGCAGNGNNFLSESECLDRCYKGDAAHTSQQTTGTTVTGSITPDQWTKTMLASGPPGGDDPEQSSVITGIPSSESPSIGTSTGRILIGSSPSIAPPGSPSSTVVSTLSANETTWLFHSTVAGEASRSSVETTIDAVTAEVSTNVSEALNGTVPSPTPSLLDLLASLFIATTSAPNPNAANASDDASFQPPHPQVAPNGTDDIPTTSTPEIGLTGNSETSNGADRTHEVSTQSVLGSTGVAASESENRGVGSVVTKIHYVVPPNSFPSASNFSTSSPESSEHFQTTSQGPTPPTPQPSDLIYCPHNQEPVKREEGGYLTCLPSPYDNELHCPQSTVCFFNGLNYHCCPDVELVYGDETEETEGKEQRADRGEKERSGLQDISRDSDVAIEDLRDKGNMHKG